MTQSAPDAQRCDLLLRLGVAERQFPDGAFRETLLEAAEIARRLGDDQRLVACALANTRGMQSETGVVDEARIATLDAALAAVGDGDSADRARLLAAQGAELMYSRQWDRRVRLSDEALAIARRLGDREALTTVLNLRFVTLLAPETLDRAAREHGRGGGRRRNPVRSARPVLRLPLARLRLHRSG